MKFKWKIHYTTASNREVRKEFDTYEEWSAFCDKLDKRIAKGTCGGYIGGRHINGTQPTVRANHEESVLFRK